MKKRKKIGLTLSKKVVSNLSSSKITGGGTSLNPECLPSPSRVCSLGCTAPCPDTRGCDE